MGVASSPNGTIIVTLIILDSHLLPQTILSIALCTRSGSPIFCRQSTVLLSKNRLESLLSAFPRLIKHGQQHTYVEDEAIRYIYHPFEAFYLVLVTNKLSNILQDIDTLQLLVKIMGERCAGPVDEEALQGNLLDIIVAFDEVIAIGYREGVSLATLHTYLAMESHEEMVQEIIARNKMQEAREAAKLKMKQIEVQKKEAARRASKGFGSDSHYQQHQLQYEEDSFKTVPVETLNLTEASASAPRLGKGMKLGRKIDSDKF